MGQFIIRFRKPQKAGRRPEDVEKSKPASQSEAHRRGAHDAGDQHSAPQAEKPSSGHQPADGRPDV